ncbi:MAG: Ni/Fe hydrogenase subunit alpha [Bdellovibrio sp. CG12_big_fil_rev_8_21_14_0_65_39_13]|nr:MAG: Ni/Fe hydrogenase subunit alpha [Bdellovibrio sp. CG22_combo_CG10-13_8_21_14_all_39_27]PIQ62999.1 MAG: Ni/Fe hydrogenase subunit alpha [Bdellovibrio sp. CG12_big_fil_rev_8_21_14_0_65_39_13]PIR32674.1 MAG: Ni/Fe hydrogenase subunit alpha [Bdellovibrio sp. CG11_big_fil_rev_8_21_14_0_20_39_38]
MTKTRKIIIDPVTRVEGHGRVTLHMNGQNEIEEARLHIVEFRGFERFVQGRPYWEAPVLVQRLCGICPVSHHLCAAKAIDEIVGMNDETLPETARQMRRLMHFGQVLQSHALHYFYLAAPDLLLGVESDPLNRNVVGLASHEPEIAKRGILIRKFGQEIIKATAGKKIHGISAVPGGIHKNLSLEEKETFLKGEAMPSVSTVVSWLQEMISHYKSYASRNKTWIDQFATAQGLSTSLIGQDGALELYHGRLRSLDSAGKPVLDDVDYHDYVDFYAEEVKEWSYMKFPFLKSHGAIKGAMKVGPLARLMNCDYIPTPLAQKALEEYRSINGRFSTVLLHYHWARLIEMLHCAEMIEKLLHDPILQGNDLIKTSHHHQRGIGFLEAPRGTLIHHYEVAETGEIRKCNLIVSTTHNNQAMNNSVSEVAKSLMNGHEKISEGMLNQIEVAIRAYDPCLSCATHAVGKMPLKIEIFRGEELVDCFVRD